MKWIFPLLLLSAPAFAEPELLVVDPGPSWVGLVTRRSGVFGFMGHEHAIRVPSWVVTLRWDPKPALTEVRRSSVDVFFQTGKLEVDNPDFRKEVGLGGGPGPEDVVKITAEMKGPNVLDVEHFPTLKFTSSGTVTPSKEGEGQFDFKGRLTLKEIEKEVAGHFKVTPLKNEALLFEGEIRFKLSDFGIKQPGAALGAVGVADEVEARVHIVTKPRTAVALRGVVPF